MKRMQKLTGFFAALLGVAASALYWHSQGKQGIEQVTADTSVALANSLFIISLILWALYMIVYGVTALKNSNKK